jgi:glycosyltransferase involved in cell wall biosynthesis
LVINLVTAVSRPDNLLRIRKSIERSLSRSTLAARWILVVDGLGAVSPALEAKLRASALEIQKIVWSGGSCAYGINQKNLGIDSIVGGYYHCIDDDNIVHPDFFQGLERAITANPKKRAFVFGQQRWDNIKSLVASPDRMEYGKIDNTMFVTHSSLIGSHRYDLSRSGREDYHFFRKLYDLHKEEFVFISETLAYYNYITHFPVATPGETAPMEIPKEKPATPAQPAATLQRAPGVLKIALYSSKRERCGISTYASHLELALATLGHDVRHWGSGHPCERTFEEVRAWKPDVFHFQHESSIMPPEPVIEKYSGLMTREGTRVMITLHTEDEATLRVARKVANGRPGRIIVHRPTSDAPEAVHVPMPCTCVGPLPERTALRRRFDLPEDAFVVSTVGFMIPWKDHPKIVAAMLPWLRKRKDVHLQVIASEHFNESLRPYADICRKQIFASSLELKENRIRHVDGYPSDAELVDRLVASDLGYVWCPFDTGSSSAAAAQFTTARCPLVATDSSHYAFLGTGIVRGPKDNVNAFIELIQKTSDDQTLLGSLRANQWRMYLERNYLATALRHVELYRAVNP